MSLNSNLQVYKALLAYPEPRRIPYEALAEKYKVSPPVVRGLVGALMRGTPKALESLKEAGYGIQELPSWVGSKSKAAQKASPKPQDTPPEGGKDVPPEGKDALPEPKPDIAKEMAAKRLHNEQVLALEKRVQSGEMIPPGSGSPSGSTSGGDSEVPSEPPSGITSNPPLPSAMGDTLQLLNQKEEGPIIEYQGRRFRVVEAGGEMKLAPVTQTKVLADEALSAAMSKAIIENIEVNMMTVAKKVALSPVVVIGHGIVTSKKDPDSGLPFFEGDIGDFINWSCNFALKNAFGIRIGVITGAPSLMTLMKATRET